VTSPFDARPIVVAVAGPNGAGKSTFYEAHLRPAGLRFVNADELAVELGVDAYQAAEVAGQLRRALVEQGESFVFETVFSDPVGDKLEFLKLAEKKGHAVVLIFIGLEGPGLSEERVAMRVLQGGHDVPTGKLRARYPRTMANLAKATKELARVMVFDNSDMRRPFRKIAVFERGRLIEKHSPLPGWLPSRR
jgi:predicted ABC-type ATPase